MITVHVWGTPDSFDEERMSALTDEILTTLQDSGYGMKKCVFFPPDRMKLDLGKEIQVDVQVPVITAAVDLLAARVGRKVAEYFPRAYVECTIYRQEPKSGHWDTDDQ